MWCNVCQSDVAIEVGADHRRVTCSTCGTVLGETAVSRESERSASDGQGQRVTEARDLLDRWASNHLFDPYGPPKKPVSSQDVTPPPASQSSSEDRSSAQAPPERLEDLLEPPKSSGVRARWDSAHSTVRRPMNLDRRDEGLRGSRPAHDAGGGVAESSRRPAAPQPRPSKPTASPAGERTGEAAGGSGLAASAAELDRLTNEILARVSRITNQREAEPPAAKPPVSDDTANTSAETDHWDDEDDSNAAEYEHRREREPVAEAPDEEADHAGEFTAEAAQPRSLAPAGPMTEPETDDDTSFAEPADPAVNNAAADSEAGTTPRRVPRPHAAAFTQRVDAAHDAPQPHADFSYGHTGEPAAATEDTEEDVSNWFSGIGQGLAWLGILGLTAGTSLVIVGYFGGPATYAPMGWLISTIGQMLLFLGIVTLVSSGMEQTTQEVRRTVNEVSRKLDLIEDRIIRIDAAAPPGPPRPHIADRMVKATQEQRAREEALRR